MLGILLSLALSVSPLPSELGPVYSPPWMGELTALLEFLPASGQGAVAGDDTLCDNPALAPHLAGSYFCLNGDGTRVSSAGMALTAVGSPATDTRAVCSNGPDCTARTGQRIDGTASYFTSPPGVSLGNAYSLCISLVWDGSAVNMTPMGSVNSEPYILRVGSDGSVGFYSNGTAPYGTSAGVVVAGAPQVLCATYSYPGSGTASGAIYVDGVSKATSTALAGPPVAGATLRIGHRVSVGTEAFKGRILGAFITSKALSASEVAAVSAAALGTVSGTKSEVLTLSRNTVSTCCRDDGTGCVVLPPGRACWAGGKLKVRPVGPNAWAESNNFGAAAWSTNALAVVQGTADCNPAPDGTWTAWRLTPTAGATDAAIWQGSFVSSAPQSAGFWLRKPDGSSASPSILITYDDAGPAITPTSNWARHSRTKATNFYPTLGGLGSWTDAADGPLCMWGGQWNQNSNSLLDYCPTGAAPASCAVEVPSVPKPATMPTATGCMALTFTPRWSTTPPVTSGLFGALAVVGGWGAGVQIYVEASGALGARIGANTTGGVYDGGILPWAAGTPYRILMQWDATGRVQLFRDGVLRANLAGQPLPSGWPTVFTLGNQSSGWGGPNAPADGAVSNVVVGNAFGACQ